MKRLLVFAVLLAWSGMSSAVVYKWVDAQGKTQYGDRPPDGVHAQIVEMLGNHPPRVSTAPTTASVASTTPSRPPADAAVKKEVAQDVADNDQKQCTDAQDQYKKLIESRRLYKTGANGERQYLTSEEIDAERIEAKRQIDTYCK